ncbi:hypothetical protein HNQ57_002599 [Zhongshania antarctica]|uniref:Uncharacterized protein n=1 Tax=Zhongshania antarctica TaxID=641702 RepID=A0A840R7G6_9GAMM|nr:hypothetical protein [Zhongshania antarctica]
MDETSEASPHHSLNSCSATNKLFPIHTYHMVSNFFNVTAEICTFGAW